MTSILQLQSAQTSTRKCIRSSSPLSDFLASVSQPLLRMSLPHPSFATTLRPCMSSRCWTRRTPPSEDTSGQRHLPIGSELGFTWISGDCRMRVLSVSSRRIPRAGILDSRTHKLTIPSVPHSRAPRTRRWQLLEHTRASLPIWSS